jgi:hypothetical protein
MTEDERWIEAMRNEFRPDPLSPERAAELRRDLARRVADDRPARRFALPALASAALAAGALWLLLPERARLTSATGDESTATSAEIESFVDPDSVASDYAERPDYLPADYEGLALLLDEDGADR